MATTFDGGGWQQGKPRLDVIGIGQVGRPTTEDETENEPPIRMRKPEFLRICAGDFDIPFHLEAHRNANKSSKCKTKSGRDLALSGPSRTVPCASPSTKTSSPSAGALRQNPAPLASGTARPDLLQARSPRHLPDHEIEAFERRVSRYSSFTRAYQ